ncbi:MAG: DUF1743 domain-containing protein [Candidatus Altiarchaeales archaeon]|nr:DUF1743 domain-containing protein [Candidatus Altiarchaeales archaeon]MBD3416772.1 DUF1743 domain-containing protein [Candidatus Altiarchaeales archaeon]
MYVAFDDTDSRKGMCTTYLAARICHRINIIGLPRLVRLNPNIPYKTRGNGAVAFRTDDPDAEDIVLSEIKKHAMMSDPMTNPGAVFLDCEEVPAEIRRFYDRAVSEIVSVEDAEKTAEKSGATVHKFKNGRGVIGAMAAIGFTGGHTYELIAYRNRLNYGKPKKIKKESVIKMHDTLYPRVFDSLDQKREKVIITPRGQDPVFCGIRGLTSEDVLSGWDMVHAGEPLERIQVFETNQATDAHIRKKKIADVKPYDCVMVSGEVSSKPKSHPGGHVVFTLTDDTGSIDCAAYKPTGPFRKIVSHLTPGDLLDVYGGIGRYLKTVNMEKIEIRRLKDVFSGDSPSCCGKKMTSAGRGDQVKCRLCGSKSTKKRLIRARDISTGFYDVPPESRRHLSRPVFLDLAAGI